jgi:hypothetical protein
MGYLHTRRRGMGLQQLADIKQLALFIRPGLHFGQLKLQILDDFLCSHILLIPTTQDGGTIATGQISLALLLVLFHLQQLSFQAGNLIKINCLIFFFVHQIIPYIAFQFDKRFFLIQLDLFPYTCSLS